MLKKLGFYAVGIPERSKYTAMRTTKDPEMWAAVLHSHNAIQAGHHMDLRLHDPETNIVYSFVVQRMPNPGEKALAIRQQDHDKSSMEFTGTIPKGQYGAGTMSKVFDKPIEVTKSETGKLSFVIHNAGTPERYTLLKAFDGNNWLLVNHTPTRTTRTVPLEKPKYPEIKPDSIDINNKDEVMAPKLDGAHNIFVIRKNKPIESFSYRKSKKGDRLIDHTYKTDLYRVIGEENAVVRGEFTGERNDRTGPLTNSEVAGMLNSSTLKSRELQQQKGNLVPYIFDIDSYGGKDTRNLNYKDKLMILNNIAIKYPNFKLPPIAHTPDEKRMMLSDIKAGKHPLTREGVVIYNKNLSVPIKAPLVKSTELKILGFFPSKSSKFNGQTVGGYVGSESSAGAQIRVGSGLDDETRKDMYQNPDKYIGNLTTITYKDRLSSGKFRVPIHKHMRTLY